jgi:hypothetical protein
VDWTDHERPFHTAASLPEGLYPTVSQNVAEAHDTEDTRVKPRSAGLAVHRAPFHPAVTVPSTVTAMQNVTEAHDTPP